MVLAEPTAPSAPVASDLEPRVCLDIGSGPKGAIIHPTFKKASWKIVRVDADESVEPDVRALATDLSAFENDSVDAIWTKSVLDHLYPHEVTAAMKEFFRVLKSGGFLFVVVLDARKIARDILAGKLEEEVYRYRPDESGIVTPLDMLFGYRPDLEKGNHWIGKHICFTGETLARRMAEPGFRVRVEYSDEFMKNSINGYGLKP